MRCLSHPADEPGKLALHFEVEDTGIGIPRAQQEKIFAMYYQVQGKKHATGTGIGLAVSRQLVQAMGGNSMWTAIRAKAPALPPNWKWLAPSPCCQSRRRRCLPSISCWWRMWSST